MNIVHITIATAFTTADLQAQSIQEKVKSLAGIDKISKKVDAEVLPSPYNYLLLQPLMTIGIEKYYQRTPVIQTIYAEKNQQNNTYSRAIFMLIDNDKARNNVLLAKDKNQLRVVELAFITINFNELSPQVINEVLNTNTPFGKILANNKVNVAVINRSYFELQCGAVLSSLTACNLHSKIYGRTNTLVGADKQKWLAQVVEILPGFLNENAKLKILLTIGSFLQ